MIVRPSRISKGRLTKPFTLQKGLKTVTVHEAQDGSLDESKHDQTPVADLQMTVKDQEVHCSERYLSRTLPASNQSATTLDNGRSVWPVAGPILVEAGRAADQGYWSQLRPNSVR